MSKTDELEAAEGMTALVAHRGYMKGSLTRMHTKVVTSTTVQDSIAMLKTLEERTIDFW